MLLTRSRMGSTASRLARMTVTLGCQPRAERAARGFRRAVSTATSGYSSQVPRSNSAEMAAIRRATDMMWFELSLPERQEARPTRAACRDFGVQDTRTAKYWTSTPLRTFRQMYRCDA